MAMDSTNTILYISDRHLLARLDLGSSSGIGTNWVNNSPKDDDNYRVVKFSGSVISGNIDSNTNKTRYSEPRDIIIDQANKYLYVNDLFNSKIRRVDLTTPFNAALSVSASNPIAYYTTTYASFSPNVAGGMVFDTTFGFIYIVTNTQCGIWKIPVTSTAPSSATSRPPHAP